MNKQAASIIGVFVGIAIIIAGFCVMKPDTFTLGERDILGFPIEFGGDYYTEMYSLTISVGSAVQRAYVNICNAIGWLIVALGAIDICYFLFKACKQSEEFDHTPNIVAPPQKPAAPTAAAPTPVVRTTTAQPTQPQQHKWRCEGCGNMRSSTPCEHCGRDETPASTAPYRCGNCGQEGPYDGVCPSCGSSIKFYN